MIGPIPDPDSGMLESHAEEIDQLNALAVYLKEHRVVFTLQYVPEQGHWSGFFLKHDNRAIAHTGRFPTEVIYRLLKEVTE